MHSRRCGRRGRSGFQITQGRWWHGRSVSTLLAFSPSASSDSGTAIVQWPAAIRSTAVGRRRTSRSSLTFSTPVVCRSCLRTATRVPRPGWATGACRRRRDCHVTPPPSPSPPLFAPVETPAEGRGGVQRNDRSLADGAGGCPGSTTTSRRARRTTGALLMQHTWTVVQHDGPNHLELCG